jgi:vacuolar-type H+-ATPase subunit I/STV1
MLIRISLIVAIIGGLAVGGVNFFLIKDKVNRTIEERDKEKDAHKKAQDLADATKKTLDKTKNDLDKTVTELASTKQQRDEAVAKAEEQIKRADSVAAELKKTQADLKVAGDKNAAWDSLGIPIETIRATLASINKLRLENEAVHAENMVLDRKVNKLNDDLDRILGKVTEVALPEGLSGKVLAVDPKYDFVVLNIGEKDGVRQRGHMLVHHNGKLVAKLEITDSIMNDRCIANVMPGWKKSDVTEGDEVFY